jgi:hypothetical protein
VKRNAANNNGDEYGRPILTTAKEEPIKNVVKSINTVNL